MNLVNQNMWVTILAGGVGSRFWPVSTPSRPKQLLPLASTEPLIVDTLTRARGLGPDSRLRILTGRSMVGPIQSVTDLPNSAFLVEPEAKGTGPVLAWAAWELAQVDKDAVLISLHSDHVIRPTEAFVDVLHTGARIASEEELLLTVAVPPDRPEIGYGYIKPGAPLDTPEGHRAYRVDSFVEKPAPDVAASYLDKGYRWNSGIFIWKATTFLEEVRAHAPEIAAALPLLDKGDVEGFFSETQNITVDDAVLARSDRVASIESTFQWDDVGSWESLSRTRESDEGGNIPHGDAHLVKASGNIAIADSGTLVLLGVEDLVVVQTDAVTVVIPRADAPQLKEYLAELPAEIRDPALLHASRRPPTE
ncbi:MAG: mannose-1-phosphate guanylyltransferase [Longimicrobiales bacterium]